MKQQIQTIIDGLSIAQELITVQERLQDLNNQARYKSEYWDTIPFSDRLNDWLRDWSDRQLNEGTKIEFVSEDDFDEEDLQGTFERHKDYYLSRGLVQVWTGESNKSIYGKPEINWAARAWHDVTHFENNLGYTPLEEIQVGKIQAAQLPEDWWFEKALIDAEVTGQILYHCKHNKFPENQREFTLNYLKTGTI